MAIDPSVLAQVKWDDEPAQPAGQNPLEIDITGGVSESQLAAQQAQAAAQQPIDLSQVVWDDEPGEAAQAVPNPLPASPTDNMSNYERFMAGAGKSVADSALGASQVLSSPIAPLLNPVGGAITYAIGQRNGLPEKLATRAAEQKQLDAPLMATGAGIGGNIAGTLAQILGPGALARGTAAAPMILPRTITGNALQGLAIGAAQPAATNEERGRNALAGGAGGTLGAVGGKILGATLGAGRNALAMLSDNGLTAAERGAGQALLREAADPAALQRVAPSQVPGVQRTLSEEVLDPGIARLERTVRSTGGQFDALDRANNAARVGALEAFAGDEATLAAANQARDQQTGSLLDQALQDRGVDVGSIRSALEKQIKETATRPSVQSALTDVKNSLDAAGDDVFSLYGTRKYIGDLLSGKAGGEKSYAQAATRELMQIKSQLDEKLADASPTFMQYLNKYRELSVPINRMEIGQTLAGRASGGAVLDPVTGAQVLTPAQFSKASRSLDDVAAKATGFAKAKADQILRPGDIAIIKSIQDDLERQAFRATAGSGGNSQTFERLGVQDRLTRGAGRELLGRAPIVGQYAKGILDVLDKTRNEQLKEKLAYLVANPEEARRVIAALPPKAQEIVGSALAQVTGPVGTAAATSANNARGTAPP